MCTKEKLLNHTINIQEDIKNMNRVELFLPYVGEGYRDKQDKTYLLVMESHFLPECFNGKVKEASKFYSLGNSFYRDLKDITEIVCERKLEKAIEHCYSAKIFSSVIENFKGEKYKTHSFYKILNNLIEFSGIDIGIIEKQFAIMNYFQRPAVVSGASIKFKEYDLNIAYANLLKIMDILKPDYIIFASIKAGNAFYRTKKNNGCLDNTKSKVIEADDYFKKNNIFIIKHLANRAVATREYSKNYKEWYKKLYQDEFKKDIKNSRDILTYIFEKKE